MINTVDWDALVGVGTGSVATAAALRLLYAKWSRDLEEIRESQDFCSHKSHDHDIRITKLETRLELHDQRRSTKTSRETD